mgnify:FL=1
MQKKFAEDNMTALEAKYEAQKLAFSPFIFQASRSLRDLGVLECIQKNGKEGITLQEIQAQTNVPEYGLKLLLDISLYIPLVTLENEKYRLTKLGFFMFSDEMTRVNMNFTNDFCYKGAEYLKESVQTEKPEGLKTFGEWKSVYEMLQNTDQENNPSWFEFDHYYSDQAFPILLKKVFEGKVDSIMDIGANTGRWSKLCLEYSGSVKVVAVDLPGQLERAKKNIDDSGFGDRFEIFPADLLDEKTELPSAVDAVWMSQFLDCFSEDEIVSILKKVRKNMREDTVVYINELFWDRQRFEAASLSLLCTSLYFTCIANGNSRMYHSADMIRCIEAAGMEVSEQIDDIGLGHTLLKCRLAPN